MIKDYVLTSAIIVTYLFIMSEFFLRIHFRKTRRGTRSEFITGKEAGIVFGLLGIILIAFNAELTSLGMMDLRHLAVIVPGALFGAGPAAIAAGMIIVARFVMHGVGSATIVSSLFLLAMALQFVLLSRLCRNRHCMFLVANLFSPAWILGSFYTRLKLLGTHETAPAMFSDKWVFMYVFGFLSYFAAVYIFESHRNVLLHTETSSKLTALLTHFQVGIVYETAAGSISFLNEAFQRLFPGMDGLVGGRGDDGVRAFAEWFEESEAFIQRRQDVLAKREAVLDEEWRLRDGRTLECDYVPILSGRQEYLGHMWKYRDITSRKQLEEAEAATRQMYQSLFEYNQSACFVMRADGRIIQVNRAAERITGYPKEMLLGGAFAPLIHRGDLERTMEHFYDALQGNSHTFEIRLLHMGGSTVDLIVNCSPVIVRDEIIGIIGLAHDMTEQKRVAQERLESIARYQKLVELSPEVVFVHGQNCVEFVNERVEELLGIPVQEIIGKSFLDFLHPEDQQVAALNMTGIFSKGNRLQKVYEYRLRRSDGTFVTTEIRSAFIEYNGEPAVLGIVHDVTKSKEAEQKLRQANAMLSKLSRSDGLTGIANRRSFDETMAQEWQRALETGGPIAVIMLDIDAFKAYNDLYGHQQGDFCLKLVAHAIEGALSQASYFAARYGGEEFAVILPDTDTAAAGKVAGEICTAVTNLCLPHAASNVQPYVTVSAGAAALVPDEGTSVADLLRQADQALYQAKHGGRNRAAWHLDAVCAWDRQSL
ncbi:diguanylate cyclase domain-containing protein [Ectobacillus ponti]|uniref:Diguanylate cyclase n=1 Tax=Ectobacillus ponti TaxID=2961894 RepID=A0AA41X438_9BACI|nr:diguanylate cyclase [Ectobacillus ponti]MCP8968377.1 diguanylate cyclase [Ectobacillus ponti]